MKGTLVSCDVNCAIKQMKMTVKTSWLRLRAFGTNIVFHSIAHRELKNSYLYCSHQCLISRKLDFIFSLTYLVGSKWGIQSVQTSFDQNISVGS